MKGLDAETIERIRTLKPVERRVELYLTYAGYEFFIPKELIEKQNRLVGNKSIGSQY